MCKVFKLSLIKQHLHLTQEDLIIFELTYDDALTLLSYIDEEPQGTDVHRIHDELHTQMYK